uniref:Uncharacterized protein n=1 Tax=Ditylenchus dipsaci TaxID=166011 RepID=A0A915D1Q8_9BILA
MCLLIGFKPPPSIEHRKKHCRMKGGISRLFDLQPDPYDCTQRQNIRICIFRDVKNAIELRSILQSGEIDAAMIRPELVAEPFVLLAAANRAIHQAAHNRINISESLNIFGIAENSRNLIVAIFDDLHGKKMVKVAKKLKVKLGKPAPLETLRELADINLIKKVYQIAPQEPELNAATLADSIITRIIAKDVA